MTVLYNLKGEGQRFTITKFDDDLYPVSTYNIHRPLGPQGLQCDCPASHRYTCRHREMLPLMAARANTPWFFCYEDKSWHDPTGEARAQEQEKELPQSAPAPFRRRA